MLLGTIRGDLGRKNRFSNSIEEHALLTIKILKAEEEQRNWEINCLGKFLPYIYCIYTCRYIYTYSTCGKSNLEKNSVLLYNSFGEDALQQIKTFRTHGEKERCSTYNVCAGDTLSSFDLLVPTSFFG